MVILTRCDSVMKKANSVRLLVYDLQWHFSPFTTQEEEDLNNLIGHLKKYIPAISAAGFFNLRKSTVMNICGTILNFFVFAIQLHDT